MDIQAMLSEMHQIYMNDPVKAVRGQAFIKILHAQIHADLTARLTTKYNVPKNLNTGEGGGKIDSTHDEKTVYSSIQGQSGAGTSQRREDVSTTCQRICAFTQPN